MKIGDAPGEFLAYFAKTFLHSVNAIDYSGIGCAEMRENFDILNIKVTIYNRDIIISELSDLPRFDIVYSLGFIEHFNDMSRKSSEKIQFKILECICNGHI